MMSFNIQFAKLLNQAVAADSVNSTAVDLIDAEGNVFLYVDARSGGTNNITVTVQHSEDNSSFSSVPASAIFNVNTGAAFTFSTIGASASTQQCGLNLQQLKRYVRINLAGTTISGHNFAAALAYQVKYSENA